MQFPARRSVVPKVGESTCIWIQGIRPVRFGPRGVKHCQLHGIWDGTAISPEAALVAYGQQLRERVIARVPGSPASVDAVDYEISRR